MAAVPRHEEIEALLERHGPMMAYVVRGILSDPHEQEECLAQVRSRVWERWETYDRERSSPATWHSAVGRILWGLALCTFRLEVFYLQYLLPLLGATLLYVGYRSLRRENRWFRLGWAMAGVHLAAQMTVLMLGGTPVLDRIGAIPWLNWSLTWALQAVNLLMLLSLRQGSRTAFALLGGGEGDETPPRDYAARLLWDVDGETRAILPQVHLAGGKTAEELSELESFFASLELERFGYSHYSPWFAFSVPKNAQRARGYLALTVQVPEGEEFTGDFAYALLQHQVHWLRYPFQSIQALGGTQAVQNKGIARTLWTGVQYYP